MFRTIIKGNKPNCKWLAGISRIRKEYLKIFLFSTAPISTLESKQPPIQWLPGVKKQEQKADNSAPSSAKVMNGGDIHPLHVIMA
jgi:hypothetical protein